MLDQDVEAVIRTHARDRKVAAWLEDTGRALGEIGEFDLAIDWVQQATDFDLDTSRSKPPSTGAVSSPTIAQRNCSPRG